MLIKVDHIDVKVPQLSEAIQFFETLGLEVVRETNPERGSVEMALPGDTVIFEIREDRSLTETQIHHVAFKLQDVEKDLQSLKDKGLTFAREAVLIKHTGRTISNLHDPRGGVWQLTD